MITNRNILCLSGTEWGGNYIKASVELLKELAPHNQILFVNSAYTLKDALDGLLGKKNIRLKRALGLRSRINTIQLDNGGKVHLLTPPVILSVNFLPEGKLYQKLIRFNGKLLERSVKHALKKLGMQDKLINFVAFNLGMGVTTARHYNEQSLIYHCYDEVKGAEWKQRHGVALEKRLLQLADGVIVTSRGLYDSKKDLCKRCFIVKNAVNFDLFSKGFRFQQAKEQVVGYIGSIDERLGYTLLKYLVQQLPTVKFVFVGRINIDIPATGLQNYPNVHFAGAKAPDELPAYLQSYSAGIIPFVKDDFTRGIYPMKINEYLAAGLPVVSTDFGDLSDFNDVVQVCSNKEAFLECLQTEMADDNTEKRKARQDVARHNTWAVRAEELSNAIQQIEAEI